MQTILSRILISHDSKEAGMWLYILCLLAFLAEENNIKFIDFPFPTTLLVDSDKFISFVTDGTMLVPASYRHLELIHAGTVAFVVCVHLCNRHFL